MPTTEDVLALACDLIRRPSVTPDDGGCQEMMIERLEPLGFCVEKLPFGDVTNFWARRGDTSPLVVLAGHTDVVTPGPIDEWCTPPFEPTVVDGWLYGRGAADMKSSLAAMIVAVERFLTTHPDHPGSIAFLITSDEEGDARDGTVKVVEYLSRKNITIDYCIVGEPSSSQRFGDVVRVGRRGSLNGQLTVTGTQGHVAYPDQALNPIHAAMGALHRLAGKTWDSGTEHFPPSTFQISNISAGTGATNVIPGRLTASFNFRFNTEHTPEALQSAVKTELESVEAHCQVDWALSGLPFLTHQGKLTEAVCCALQRTVSITPELSTSGGTSDGRFVAPTGAEVVELGPVNKTIHKVNEKVALIELEPLANAYRAILASLLG